MLKKTAVELLTPRSRLTLDLVASQHKGRCWEEGAGSFLVACTRRMCHLADARSFTWMHYYPMMKRKDQVLEPQRSGWLRTEPLS